MIALDWFDRLLTSEVRMIVRESLDELLHAERQRHVAYEFYKQMLAELIREIQDSVVSCQIYN